MSYLLTDTHYIDRSGGVCACVYVCVCVCVCVRRICVCVCVWEYVDDKGVVINGQCVSNISAASLLGNQLVSPPSHLTLTASHYHGPHTHLHDGLPFVWLHTVNRSSLLLFLLSWPLDLTRRGDRGSQINTDTAAPPLKVYWLTKVAQNGYMCFLHCVFMMMMCFIYESISNMNLCEHSYENECVNFSVDQAFAVCLPMFDNVKVNYEC